jgi:predicted metal-binding protein
MFISQEKKELIEKVISQFGIQDYKWIDPKDIIVAQWVRMKCVYGCDDYGRACCPPNTPSVDECREFFNEYTSAIVIHFHFDAEKGNYPKKYSHEMYNNLLDIERDVFLSGFHKAFMFNQNCCTLCKECVKRKEDCLYPEKSRPSPEAFAVDVFGTARNLGLPISVVTEPHQKIDRFAILMIE